LSLQIITDKHELTAWLANLPPAQSPSLSESKFRIGLVPTMGALHDGHLTLIRQARNECQRVVVSIFVNPLQFGPTEDFGKYPRTFERDRELCEKENVDVIFHPTVDVMYPGGQTGTTKVVPPEVLEKSLYGQYRPAFFS
jgi:pantoate--beta-alanine ligase